MQASQTLMAISSQGKLGWQLPDAFCSRLACPHSPFCLPNQQLRVICMYMDNQERWCLFFSCVGFSPHFLGLFLVRNCFHNPFYNSRFFSSVRGGKTMDTKLFLEAHDLFFVALFCFFHFVFCIQCFSDLQFWWWMHGWVCSGCKSSLACLVATLFK